MAKRHAAAAAFFVLLSVAMTWPLATAIDRLVAYPGDPYINTWILDWDWYATVHRPFKLFQANIFHPAQDSLAFSENLYGLALLLMPLRAAGVGPLAAHNIAMLAGFAFSGFAAYLLGYRISGSFLGGIAAGMFYAFAPWRFTQLPHVQHVWGGWVPMLLVALLHYANAPDWRRAALLGGVFLINGLTNIHWFLFGSIMLVLSIPIVVRQPRHWPRALAAIAVALALLTPFLLPYAHVAEVYGMKRNWEEVKMSSATLHDWLNPGVTNRFYRRFVDMTTNPECWLFPGALAILLSLVGFAAGGGRRSEVGGQSSSPPTSEPRPPTPRILALLWIAVGFVGSLGIHTFFYRFLFSYAPGFRAVRVPARWANITYVGMAILIAIAVAWIARNRRWAGVVVMALFAIELRAAPIRWYSTTPDVPTVYRWLEHQHVRIAQLPIDTGESEYSYMRWAATHHRPVINGVSGFAPPEFARLSEMWRADPIRDDFVVELHRIGVNLVILQGDYNSPHEVEWLRRELRRGRLSYVARFDHGTNGDWVFELRSGRSTAPELERFLRGEYTYSSSTFGLLDYPKSAEHIRTPTLFSGWALSPWGIRKVDLLFDNGRARYPTNLIDDRVLKTKFPWYSNTPHPRYIAAFAERPANVRPDTDVQVEITDGRGKTTLLEGRWFEWER
jgi:hypothetical protein